MFGAIEAGGTKFVCSIGDDEHNIGEQISLPTSTPEETMPEVVAFFKPYIDKMKAIGIGSFGPIDIQEDTPTYGHFTNTPKVAWQGFDFVGYVKTELNDIPVAWTTDVNAAAYGELTQSPGNSLVYFTVGTGLGGGAIQNGQFIGGINHAEMGHILIRKHPNDSYEGYCIYHGDCLEGLACGPTIEARYGIKGQDLSEDHEVWDFIAYYLAQAAMITDLTLAPQRIVFGGGVLKQPQLIGKIRSEFERLLKDYRPTPPLDEYIITPILGDNAATIGCLAMAKEIVA
ncbi:ROK family protein [Aerococcaceae bacterium DSM 111020]|nr:ROK family protein [Aerococcaceae bacterium DSM 111020]